MDNEEDELNELIQKLEDNKAKQENVTVESINVKNDKNQQSQEDNNTTDETTSKKVSSVIATIISICIIVFSICAIFDIDFTSNSKSTNIETELKSYVRENYTGYNIKSATVTSYSTVETSGKNVIYKVDVKFSSSNALGKTFENYDAIYVMVKNGKAVSWFKPNYALKDTYDSWKKSNDWN